MRSTVLIAAALAVPTVRLLSGDGAHEAPVPASSRAAGAAAALLAAAASAPVGSMTAADAPPAGGTAGVANAAPAPQAGSAATAPPGRLASARRAMHAAAVEEEVRVKRRHGESEDTIYRARAARLPQADLAQLMEREAVEAEWGRRLEACRAGHCDPGPVDQRVNVAAYQRAASPSLTLE